MTEIHSNFLYFSVIASIIMLSLAFVLIFIRLVIGPSLPDRVVALDAISMICICIISVLAIARHQPLYLDVVIALALISFLGTIAFAQFTEWQLGDTKNDKRGDPK